MRIRGDERAGNGGTAAEQAPQTAERLPLHVGEAGVEVVEGGQHEVLKHGDVVGVDGFGGDRHAEDGAGAGGPDAHHAPAGHALDLPLGGVGLGRHHLLRLLEQPRQVAATEQRAQVGTAVRVVASVAGGIKAWEAAGLPVVAAEGLTPEQRMRYSRHTLLPEVGVEGQVKLLNAKVLLIGAGGLGSPSALYLAAAGIGTLGLVDDDLVDESNLQRQVIHTTDRVGVPKTESARLSIQALNPEVEVVEHNTRLDATNVLEIIGDGGVPACRNADFTQAQAEPLTIRVEILAAGQFAHVPFPPARLRCL